MATPKIPTRSDWRFDQPPIILDKNRLTQLYIREMFNRTQRIFEWRGLPDSIPQKDLEWILQWGGYAVIVRNEGKNARNPDGMLYAVTGGLGGKQSPYYLPLHSQIANPWLAYEGEVTFGEDSILILNDSQFLGLYPINEKYASLLAETDLSLRIATINSRIVKIIKAGSDSLKTAAEEYLRQVEEGKRLGVIGEDDLFEQFKTEDYATGTDGTHIKELIELQQYLKSQWYIELGLNSNYNMKREAINSAESGMNDDILTPLIDEMLEQRKVACEKVNKLFGTNWTVELASAWKQVQEGEEDEENPDQGSDPGPSEVPA